MEVDPLEGIIPAQTKDKILAAKKQGEKQRKDPIAEAAKQAKQESKGKIYTGPMSIEQARGSAMIVNQSPTTKESATVLSSPAIVTMGDDKFIEMVADNGAIVLVPAREIEVSEGKVTLMPAAQVVAERKLITEVIPADPMSMGEQQQKALFGAIGEANLDRMTREEVEAMQSTLDKIAKRGTGVLEERTTELQSKALEAVRRFEERNNIVSDQPTPPVEQDTLADAMFRLKVGIDKETDLVRQRNIPTPIKTPEEEARMIKAESLKSVIDAAMRRRGMDDAAQLLQRPEQMNLPGIQFMAVQRGDIWTPPPQQITSAATSINEQRLPATFNRVTFEKGTINADIGGGRFDNGTQFLASKGVQNIIYDPFNRSAEYNAKSVEQIRGGKADTVTVNNVLNVIQEQLSRDLTIAQAADALKPDGTAYFLIYEGDKSSFSRETTKGWQENRPAESYMAEIGMHFGDVSRSGNLIIAKDPINKAMDRAQFMVVPPRTEPREPVGGRMTGGDIIAGVKPPQNIGNSVKDISTYLNESGKQAGVVDYRSSSQKENEQIEDSIVDMLRESVRIHPESVGWYRENVDLAMSVMRELDADLSKKENSFRLKLAIALTSDGNEVDQNFQMGWNVYNNWKIGKSFDATMGLGARQSSIKDKLVAANKLIDKLGGEVAAEKWLLQKDTVGNIAAELQSIYGITRKQAMDMLGGELVTTVVPKAVIFGPKLGSFFNNLSGDYSTVTMDLWFMRSVGRMTGTLVYEETKESIAQGRSRLSDALKSSPAALKFLGLKSIPKGEKLDELATSIINRSVKKDFREALSGLEGGEEVLLS